MDRQNCTKEGITQLSNRIQRDYIGTRSENETISYPQFLPAEDTQRKIEPQNKDQIHSSVRKSWTQGKDEAEDVIVKPFVMSSEREKKPCKVLKGLQYSHSLLNNKASKNLKSIVPQQLHREPKVEKGLSRRQLQMWLFM